MELRCAHHAITPSTQRTHLSFMLNVVEELSKDALCVKRSIFLANQSSAHVVLSVG